MNQKNHLGIYSGVYAIFYSFCLYKNLGGATFPFFVIGTLCYFMLCIKEFNLTWKKDSIITMVVAILIGVSQMLTANPYIQAINVLVVFLLLTYIVLHQFVFDEKWNFIQYLINILRTYLGGFSHFFSFFADISERRREKAEAEAMGETSKKSFPWYIPLITIIACIPMLSFVIMLLCSADAIFSDVLTNIFSGFEINSYFFGFCILTIFVFFFIYGLIRNLTEKKYSSDELQYQKANPLVAITAGIMFDAVYLLFCGVQIRYLFFGKNALPSGYSYSSYAREGFFELLFVCIINLALVLVGIHLFDKIKSIRIILTILSGCTYIMVASSAFRMILYIRYYYFTFLRVFVLWALFVIALLLTGIIIQIWSEKFNLFKYGLLVICICYSVLAFSRPDYFVAKFNCELNNSEATTGSFFLSESPFDDYSYLVSELSEDAYPVLEKYNISPDISTLNEVLEYKPTIRNFNISKYMAKKYAQSLK